MGERSPGQPPPDQPSVSARSRSVVKAERAADLAAEREADRRRRSLAGRLERVVRWVRNPRSGPWPRLRRMGRVMVDVARSPRALPALPGALLAAARLPPIGAGLPPARPSRSLEPERAAARDRLIAFDRAVVEAARPLRVALIADEALSARVAATCEATAIRPEDWRAVLTAAAPDVLVIGSAWYGNGGAWQYRVGWYAHPDALLLPDLRALLAWCGEARVPSIFWDTGGARTVPRFGDAAGLCDLILAGDPATVAAYRALPARRGVGVVLETAEASGTSVADRLRSGLAARSEATA